MTSDEVRPLYAVLAVPSDASPETIKRAYRRLALEHHPDRRRGNAPQPKDEDEAFARVAFAYEVLGNEQRRKRYDLSGELPQSDAALGRRARETFLEEYVKAAPKVTRTATEADMSLHSLANYEVLEVDGRDVPDYMRGIVMQGLSYLVAVVDGMEEKEVVLLRHFVMDQMYAMLVYSAPLDEGAFAERGYIITYYDHPLQAGIQPSWSDQNGFEHRKDGVSTEVVAGLKNIDPATFERRRLVALEWKGGATPADAADEAVPAASGPRAVPVPGAGRSQERLLLGVRALLKAHGDLEGRTVHVLRRELEGVLVLEAHALDDLGASALMMMVFEAAEDGDDEGDTERVGGGPRADCDAAAGGAAEAVAAVAGAAIQAPQALHGQPTTGSNVMVQPSGQLGVVAVHDPSDMDLTYKVQFDDGSQDWFRHAAVVLA